MAVRSSESEKGARSCHKGGQKGTFTWPDLKGVVESFGGFLQTERSDV